MCKSYSLIISVILIICNTAHSQVPNGYTLTYGRDFETSQNAGEYLGNDVWYFYSYGNNVTSSNHPELHKRFIIVEDPAGVNNKVLKMIKFNGDKDYSNSNLNPRTELSGRPAMTGNTSDEIYFHIKTYFPNNQRDVFAAEFTQFWMHGSTEIPLQIEVRNGYFAARDPRSSAGSIRLTNNAKLNEHLGRWITWEVRAKFNNTGGYWHIYMDGNKVFTRTHSMATWPGNNQQWHPQFGIYANNGGSGQMEIYFDDLKIARYTGGNSPANRLPEVKLITPVNEKQFVSPATIQITADASDPDGSISKVDFYNGSTLLGSKSTSPFTWTWENVITGTYSISAKATDNKGESNSSNPVSVTVSDPPEDCNGVIKGTALYDECGICAGGNTGVKPNENCNKECGKAIKVYASDYDNDSNKAENTIDGSYDTRWSTDKEGAQIVFSLPCPVNLNEIGIAFFRGNERKTQFDIEISSDSINWNMIFNGQSNGTSLKQEMFKVSHNGYINFVRIKGYGNNLNEWTSITQVGFYYKLKEDCSGVRGGTASIDSCGVCSGGNTGIAPEEHCNSTAVVNTIDKNKDALIKLSSSINAVSFELAKKTMVKISMISLNGKVTRSIVKAELGAGSHRMKLSDFNLPKGIYLCSIQVGLNKGKTVRVLLN